MYAIDQDTVPRRLARRALALLGLAAMLLAAGIDSADAATGVVEDALMAAATWLSFAAVGIVLFVVYRRNVPSRARRLAIARRRAIARTRRA